MVKNTHILFNEVSESEVHLRQQKYPLEKLLVVFSFFP